MSKLRSVSTKIWSDTWFEELSASHKLLFIYLITNEKTNMLGIYEASVKKIAFETGLKKDDVEKGLKYFEKSGRVNYNHNHIILVKFLKHQNFNTNMKKSAIDVYNDLPKELKHSELRLDKSNPLKAFETLSNHLGMVSKIEVEYEYEYEYELEEEEEVEDEKEDNKLERENEFRFLANKLQHEYSLEMIEEFCDYWTESKPNGKKMKFEMQKTFDISRRLKKWSSNNFNQINNAAATKSEKPLTYSEKYFGRRINEDGSFGDPI